jgi:hypothetical protein
LPKTGFNLFWAVVKMPPCTKFLGPEPVNFKQIVSPKDFDQYREGTLWTRMLEYAKMYLN